MRSRKNITPEAQVFDESELRTLSDLGLGARERRRIAEVELRQQQQALDAQQWVDGKVAASVEPTSKANLWFGPGDDKRLMAARWAGGLASTVASAILLGGGVATVLQHGDEAPRRTSVTHTGQQHEVPRPAVKSVCDVDNGIELRGPFLSRTFMRQLAGEYGRQKQDEVADSVRGYLDVFPDWRQKLGVLDVEVAYGIIEDEIDAPTITKEEATREAKEITDALSHIGLKLEGVSARAVAYPSELGATARGDAVFSPDC